MKKLVDFSEEIKKLENFRADLEHSIQVVKNTVESENSALKTRLTETEKSFNEWTELANEDVKFIYNRQLAILKKELDNLRIR